MKYEGYMNHLKRPSLVVFLNTSQLSDALAENEFIKNSVCWTSYNFNGS